jgi:exodeoxyribonuclease VII large subunit
VTGIPTGAAAGFRVLDVADVTRTIRDALRVHPDLRDIWVRGQVGRVSPSTPGHLYFTLTDGRSQLDCVLFSRERASVAFEPQMGLQVVVHGRIDVFEQQGRVQLYVDAVEPAGFGEMALRLEALKRRLAAEGLFDAARKRPLPASPARIAVVTSPTGAAWHDVRTVVERRWPLVDLILAPCLVQGDAAPASIVAAFRGIALLPAEARPDVVILARGGGSVEDLAAFNDEAVVRAIGTCAVPVVVGVGHEIDSSLADLAADVRAPTPSAAGELVVPDRTAVRSTLGANRARLDRLWTAVFEASTAALAAEQRALERLGPLAQLDLSRERAGALLDRATVAVRAALERRSAATGAALLPLAAIVATRVARARAALETAAAGLDALDPQATLERGYAIVRITADGRVLRDAAEVAPGAAIAIRVARGGVGATVTRVEAPDPRGAASGSSGGDPGRGSP